MADDIFKEVDDEVRAERLRAAGRRFAALGAALLLIVAIAAGLWKWQAYRAGQRAAATSETLFAATRLADSIPPAGAGQQDAGGAAAKASALFGQVVASPHGPDGLRTLARLRTAQLAWQAGQTAQALGTWDAIRDDAAADPTLRGLASLLSVQHQMSSGDPALLKSRLGALSRPGDPWRPMAQELDAELDLRLGHVADARRKLGTLSEDGNAPEGLRSRAAGLNDTLEATKTGG